MQINFRAWGGKLLRLLTQKNREIRQLAPIRQVTIQRGEVYPVTLGYHALRVISGVAWLTQRGEDYVLEAGQLSLVEQMRGNALVSALNQQSVTFELS